MGTKKQKKRLQKRKRATKAVKALGRRRAEQLTNWLYDGYNSHYKPEIHYQQYVAEYDQQIVKSVYGRTRFKNFNISFEDLETFYGMRRKRFKKRQEREYRRRLEQQCVRVTFLGTAYSSALNFYNTCFAIRNHKKTFLVDTGGGQYILRQIRKLNISLDDIHDIFITHNHLDHILGIYWLLRDITWRINDGKYTGDLTIYGSDEVLQAIKDGAKVFNSSKTSELFGDRIKLREIHDGETVDIIGQKITFFDTHSEGPKQFGLKMETSNGVTFTYLGDSPYNDYEEKYCKNVDYLVHEAFCLQADQKLYKPHKRGHSTLKDACENFKKTGARYLVITHTEDNLGDKRGPHYRHEAAVYHHTSIMVPDDLETIFLKRPSKQRSYFDNGIEKEVVSDETDIIEA